MAGRCRGDVIEPLRSRRAGVACVPCHGEYNVTLYLLWQPLTSDHEAGHEMDTVTRWKGWVGELRRRGRRRGHRRGELRVLRRPRRAVGLRRRSWPARRRHDERRRGQPARVSDKEPGPELELALLANAAWRDLGEVELGTPFGRPPSWSSSQGWAGRRVERRARCGTSNGWPAPSERPASPPILVAAGELSSFEPHLAGGLSRRRALSAGHAGATDDGDCRVAPARTAGGRRRGDGGGGRRVRAPW